MSVPDSVVPTGPKGSGSITVASATAIGVGGMMGAGLYTLVGLASTTAGVWLPLAFLVGGVVTVFSVYSYAKLGARYPSRGGAAQFLIKCFGDGVIAGGLNVFQFLGWIIAMALYCAGFAGYLRALLPWHTPDSFGHLRLYRETGAKPWLLVLAIVLNLVLFALLLGYTIHTGPASTWITLLAVLALSFGFEVVYRNRTGRSLVLESAPAGS
jgi:amino acid transporter